MPKVQLQAAWTSQFAIKCIQPARSKKQEAGIVKVTSFPADPDHSSSRKQMNFQLVQELIAASDYVSANKQLHSEELKKYSGDQIYLTLESTIYDNLQRDDDFLKTIAKFERRYPESHNPAVLKYYFYCNRRKYKLALDALSCCKWPSDPMMRTALLYKRCSLEIYLHADENKTLLAPPDADCLSAPEMSIAACMMIKDEDDIILANLEHHYALGIRKFFLLNNNSADFTSDEIAHFRHSHKDALVVVTSDPVVGYYQRDKTRALCAFALAYCSACDVNIEYCLILDADEFVALPPGVGFCRLLEGVDRTVVKSIVFDLCDTYFHEDWTKIGASALYAASKTTAYNSGNIVTKNMVHVSAIGAISMGNHFLSAPELLPRNLSLAIMSGGRIIHLAYRGIDHTRRKIVNGGQAFLQISKSDNATVGSHWKKAYDDYLGRGETAISEFYKRHITQIQANAGGAKPPFRAFI